MVRVAVDATPLLGDRTGVGVAVAGALEALAGRSDLELIGYALSWRGRRGLSQALPAGVKSARAGMVAAGLLPLWARADAAPAEWWTGRVEVVHGTNFVVPPSPRAARLVTVHDLTPLRFPELCTPTSRRYPHLVRRAVAGGAWVHTPSHAVAGEVVEQLGAPPERVRVVPWGVASRGENPPPGGPNPPEGSYVLALGTAEPRKDLVNLVHAFDRIAGERPALELRLVGPSGWGEEALAAALAGARHRDRIRREGWVADPGGLLGRAAVLAFPSRYEGFGFPPLEAMAAGVPVVATDAGAIAEVTAGAARLVPVGDEQALAAALADVVDDPDERARLVAAGRERVKAFTWRATAAGLAALYEELAATAG